MIPVRDCEKQGRAEKLGHNAVTSEASADPMGSTGVEMALLNMLN